MIPHSTSSTPAGSRLRGFSINGPLGISLLALALAAGFVVAALATVLSAAFAGGTRQVDAGEEVGKLVAKNQGNMKVFQDRFNGRSVFFKPPAPRAEPTPQPVVRESKPAPPPAPPSGPSKNYEGPSIIYAIGDRVRFKPKTNNSKPLDIRVGEEVEGVRVIGVNLPWHVRVGYKGGEYDVPIFARMGDKYLVASADPVTVVPGIIEVMPPKHEVEIPKGTSTVDSGGTKEPAANAGRQGRGGSAPARATAAPARQSPPPPREPPAANAQNDDEEEDAEPSDPETEADADEPDGGRQRPSRREAEGDDDEDEADAEARRDRGRGSPSRPRPQPRNAGGSSSPTPSH